VLNRDRPLAYKATTGNCPAEAESGKFIRRLLDDDLNLLILRLANSVPVCTRGLDSPLAMTVMARAGTPPRTSASFTALARRSDSARL
jgi:hypothetical protein